MEPLEDAKGNRATSGVTGPFFVHSPDPAHGRQRECSRVDQGRHILVVDDDPAICGLLSGILVHEGYRPVAAQDPSRALGSIQEHPGIELAFVDINLPGMDGIELARRLKQRLPDLEVAFITGYGTFENAVQALKIGAYDYLRKPFSADEFLLCLRRFEHRKALREHARAADRRYQRLVEDLPVLVFSLGPGFTVRFVNKAARTLLSYSPEEIQGLEGGFLRLVHEEDREKIRKILALAFDVSGARSFSAGCRLLHKEGFVVHALVKTIARDRADLLSPKDTIEAIAVDITDRILLEKSAIQNEKLKTLGSVAAEVAHEIRNPLVSVGGYAYRLKKKLPQCIEAEIIVSECTRLERLVQRIDGYLRPTRYREELYSPNSVLRRCLLLLNPEVEKHRLALDVELQEELGRIKLDPDMLTEVFINLIRNAIYSLNEGGCIHIRSYRTNGNVCITFKNRMEKRRVKNPEDLFLPFGEGGGGIGLPLSFRLVKSMGGLLSFSQEGDYAVFTVAFPRSAEEEELLEPVPGRKSDSP